MRSVTGIVERFLKIVARFKYIFLSQGLSVITKFSYFSYYVTFFDTLFSFPLLNQATNDSGAFTRNSLQSVIRFPQT